jgi:hypothetical protein
MEKILTNSRKEICQNLQSKKRKKKLKNQELHLSPLPRVTLLNSEHSWPVKFSRVTRCNIPYEH